MGETQAAWESLSPPVALSLEDLHGPVTIITAAGFENRVTAFLSAFQRAGRRADLGIIIQYKPRDSRNREGEVKSAMRRISAAQKTVAFNRFNPEVFSAHFGIVWPHIPQGTVIIDITGMSKMLILAVLSEVRTMRSRLVLAYAEAVCYFPTPEQYAQHLANQSAASSPEFLTSGIEQIVTTSYLSSVAMQGYPSVLVAAPTFNPGELMALVSEMAPKRLVSLDCLPLAEHNQWRKGAIHELNEEAFALTHSTHIEVSTFDYRETLRVLEEVYTQSGGFNRIVVAPTGSKLQAVAVFLFKLIRPDVQIVYPMTKRYLREHARDVAALWMVDLGFLPQLMASLEGVRTLQASNLLRHLSDSSESSG